MLICDADVEIAELVQHLGLPESVIPTVPSQASPTEHKGEGEASAATPAEE